MERGEEFTAINPCIFDDPNLKVTGWRWMTLYLVLSDRVGEGVFSSQKELARFTGHSKTTIRKYIKIMKETGLIETSKVGNKTLYTILPYKYKGEICFIDSRDLDDKELEEFKRNNYMG